MPIFLKYVVDQQKNNNFQQFWGKDWLLLSANHRQEFQTYVFYLVNGCPIIDAFIFTNQTAKIFTDNQSEATIL